MKLSAEMKSLHQQLQQAPQMERAQLAQQVDNSTELRQLHQNVAELKRNLDDQHKKCEVGTKNAIFSLRFSLSSLSLPSTQSFSR